MEWQSIAHPPGSKHAGPAANGVIDVEAMRMVAYCGGITFAVRIDEVPPGGLDSR